MPMLTRREAAVHELQVRKLLRMVPIMLKAATLKKSQAESRATGATGATKCR